MFALLLLVRAATAGAVATVLEDSETLRARKRLRIGSPTQSSSSSSIGLLERADNRVNFISSTVNHPPATAMRYSESDQDSLVSVSANYNLPAGPSSAAMGDPGPSSSSNGYPSNAASMNGNGSPSNGFVGTTNGSSTNGIGNGIHKTHGKSVMRVNLPGTLLYDDDDSMVDREEFVRLVIQSLRDVGYL